jgi:hypothetical protein
MRIFVKPSRPDLIVKDKFGRTIPSNGKSVCYDVFIKRLLKSGDLVLVKINKPKSISKKQEENDANSRTK